MQNFKGTIFSCYRGYIVQGIVNNLSPLFFVIYQKEFGLSYSLISSLILLNFVTQMVVDLLCVKFVDKIGYRASAVAAHAFGALGMIFLGTLPHLFAIPFIGLAIATITSAIGGGMIEVIISPIIDSLPSDAKDAKMSLLHSFYCWGQVGVVLLTTGGIRIMGEGFWWIIPIFWALIPLYNLIRFSRVPLMPPVPEDEKLPLRHLFRSKFFILAMILMLCAGACELSMSQWSSLFAEKALGVPKLMGDLLGPCLFAVFMGIGRTLYGVFGSRLRLMRVLIISSILCIGCYLGTVLFTLPFLSLFSCALCGFSVSLMWPGVLSSTSEIYPGGGTAMFGILAICGDIGCSVGPAMTGAISDVVKKQTALAASWGLTADSLGLKAGMLAAVIFPAILFVTLLLLRRSQKISDPL